MLEPAETSQAKRRDFVIVSTTQFFLAFALNFMLVFLPFYVHRISTLEEAATLRWLGLIVGAAPAMATFGSTFWGRLTDRYSPKSLFERGMLSHATLVILMGFTTDLRLLFAIRVVQGFFGGISTIGLIRSRTGVVYGFFPLRANFARTSRSVNMPTTLLPSVTMRAPQFLAAINSSAA